MQFNSYHFLFAFLPVTLAGYFLLGRLSGSRLASVWLVAASLFFYGCWNPDPEKPWTPFYLLLISVSIIGNYFCGVHIARATEAGSSGRAKLFLTIGVVLNLVALGWFKYAKFFVDTANALTASEWQLTGILLPLAISFFTFTQIAYLTDAYHGVTKQYDFLHYSLFVTFFPHLIAGPIVFYRNLMPQFARPETYRFQPQNFAGGLTLAVVGLAKKVVIADQLAPVAGHVFGGTQGGGAVGMVAAWVGVLAFTLQLYFDFSGYSDMAVGFARMFNTTFPTNFDSPYKARDIVDFWRRWHITLSNFLRDHIYIPLGGNRHGAFARYRNLFVTMLLGGLWHGAGWTFVIWGGLHGLYLVVNHAWLHFANGRAWTALWPLRGLGWLVTLVAVMVGWVFFRAASVADAMNLLARMAGTGGLGAKGLEITAQQGAVLLMAALIAVLAPNTNAIFRLGEPLKGNGAEQPAPLWRLSPVTAVATALLFVVVVLHLSQISTFLYFQF